MESPKPEFHVPGAYHFDNFASNSLPARALGADIFLPPADLARSTGSLFSDMSITTAATNNHEYVGITTKRKRPQDFSRESTPVAGEYTLAGQIDVDGTQSSQGMDESAYYSDVEYRRQLGPGQESHTSQNGDVSVTGERWTVLNALGNVVGKVWSFCTAGAFRGFHAGGGNSYDWETGKPAGEHQVTEALTGFTFSNGAHQTEEDPSLKFELSPTGPSPLAKGSFAMDGGWTSTRDGRTHYSYDRKEGASTPPLRRYGKRRQVGPSGDELNRNWVMVDTSQRGGGNGGRASRASSIATMRSSPSIRSRTPDHRSSQYRTAKFSTATPSTAASLRRISTPTSRLGPSTPSVTPSTAQSHRQQRVSHAGSPGLSTREPASFASPRASTPVGLRRATMAGDFQTSCSPGGRSRIPVPSIEQAHNPFSRLSSSRPSSSLGQRSSSSLGQRPGSAMSSSPGHRRSYSAVTGSEHGRQAQKKSPKKAGALESFEESPHLTNEAKRLAARKIVAERDADAKIESLNYQLQQMIRQGREALGTTFEVDIGDGDDGEGGDDLWADDL